MIVCPKVLSVVMNSQNDRHNDANKGGISARCRLKRAQTPIYTTLLPYEAIKLCDLEDRLEQQPFLMKLRRVWFCYVREGKDYLVVHDVSAVITLFFFLIFTLFFLFSSNHIPKVWSSWILHPDVNFFQLFNKNIFFNCGFFIFFQIIK